MQKYLAHLKILDILIKFRYPLLIFSILFFLGNLKIVYNLYLDEIDKEINDRINTHVSHLSDQIEGYGDAMYSFRAIFAIHSRLEKEEWDVCIAAFNFQARYPQNIAMSYVEVMSTEEATSRNITGLSQEPEHYVVLYTTANNSGSIISNDLGNDQDRLATLRQARDTGHIVATPPVKSLSSDTVLLVLYMPIYKYNFVEKDATVEDRRNNIQGFMSLAINLNNFLNDIFVENAFENFNLTVSDSDVGVIYQKGPDMAGAQAPKEVYLDLSIGDRIWKLNFLTNRMIFFRNSDNFLLGSFISGRALAIFALYLVLELYHRKAKNIPRF